MSEEKIRQPELVRDSSWLAGSDLIVIALGLLGQAFLAANLLRSDYGLLVVLIDAFALIFLLVDAGLPTIITRDIPRSPSEAKSLVMQSFKLQLFLCIIMVPIGLIIGFNMWDDASRLLLLSCAGIAILHVFTYAPRSALRALGEARKEAVVKLIERFATTSGYCILAYLGSNDPTNYAIAFFIGVLMSLIYALYSGSNLWNKFENVTTPNSDSILLSDKDLIISALPFAITLGIIPLIGRLEKILISWYHGTSEVAVFHVAFLAYLAGLTLPQAIRAALLPILGRRRSNKKEMLKEIKKARKFIFWLTPIGIVGGAFIVKILMEVAFPDYVDESYSLFIILLLGWTVTMITAPNYVAVQAGQKPWNFTIMLFIGVGIATLSAFALIPGLGVVGAAWSSVIGATTLGVVAVIVSGEFAEDTIKIED